jgi:hypothetical protein
MQLSITRDLYFVLKERFFDPLGDQDVTTDAVERISRTMAGCLVQLERIRVGADSEYRLTVSEPKGSGLGALFDEVFRGAARPIPEADAVSIPPRPRERLARNSDRFFDLVKRLSVVPTLPYTLDCGFTRFEFRCDRPLVEIPELLSPYFSVSEGDDGDFARVVAVGSRALYEAGRTLCAGYEYQAWNRIYGHPEVRARGEGAMVFALPEGGVIGQFRFPSLRDSIPVVFLKPSTSDAWVVLYDAELKPTRYSVARVLRTFLVHRALATGRAVVHASAFVTVSGNTFLLCGDERSGKTTHLIAALTHLPGVSLLSNDRVVLNAEGGVIRAYGFPHSIGVRLGTLLLNDALKTLLADADPVRPFVGKRFKYDQCYCLETSGDSASQFVPNSELRLYFSPAELAELLGSQTVCSGTLRGIILPSLDREAGAGRWEPVSPSAARVREVLASYRHRYYDNGEPFWNDLLPAPGPDQLSDDAISRVPLVRLYAGEELAATWAQFAAWFGDQSTARLKDSG